MKKEEYNRYKARIRPNTRDKSPYGQPCLVCGSRDHVKDQGVEYRVERYKFHEKTEGKYQRTIKGVSRRFFICGDCWQKTAGEEYSLEW